MLLIYRNILNRLPKLTKPVFDSGAFVRRLSNEVVEDKQQSQSLLNMKFTKRYRVLISRLCGEISKKPRYLTSARAMYIDNALWSSYVNEMRREIIINPELFFGSTKAQNEFSEKFERVVETDPRYIQEGSTNIPHNDTFTAVEQGLFELLLNRAVDRDLVSSIRSYKALCMTTDLTEPHDWYPYARLIRRKVFYHGGPTNSGKTYHAIKRLKESGCGVYAGPLRLLALEVYEQLNRQGVHTSLMTGQEQRHVPFATHVACTIEMISLDKEYDVVVLDEVQMIADRQRGSAWTRALQGVRAKEIHVCGGLEVFEIVKNIVESMGDEFELKKYDRLSELKIANVSLEGDYSKVQPGDCVVAFSKADIFSIKREIERLTPYRCCTVYGQLPSETRSSQARLFNEENTGYDILVASDAIGMGLNLNIRRIIFHSVLKKGHHTTGGTKFIDPSNIKQIAGRAGRMSSKYKVGEVTAWQNADLAYVRAVMSWNVPQLKAVGLFPSIDQVEIFSEKMKKLELTEMKIEATNTDNANVSDVIRLSSLMAKFVDVAQLDGRYFMCDHDDMIVIANWLHTIPMTLPERFLFSSAPVNTKDQTSMNILYSFAAAYAQRRPVAMNIRFSKYQPTDVFSFMDLCAKYNALDLYLWLSFRFPKYFIERDNCLEQREFALKLIEKALFSSNLQQDFSHKQEYAKVRENLLKNYSDGLPPEEFGSIRETTATFLEEYGSMNLFKIIEDRHEVSDGEQKSNSSSSRYSQRSNSSSSRFQKKPTSRKRLSQEGGQ